MSKFLKSGNSFRVFPNGAIDLRDKLPVGNYVIKEDPMTGELYIEKIDSFTLSGKVYGDTLKYTDRIFNTFMDREASTGTMLVGEKGSGKTLLAKSLVVKAAENDIPTVIINAPWVGDKFNQLIQSIDQECVILFDEFEKVYPSKEQEQILTLLDGVYPSKKLFVLTCNDRGRVDTHMKNRPGRIYYMFEFQGLEENFIREYCEDNLKYKDHIESIVGCASVFGQFNFDMLKALVEEVNRYNEAPAEVLKILNARPEYDSGTRYEVSIVFNGEVVPEENVSTKFWDGNPMDMRNEYFNFKVLDSKNIEDPEDVEDDTPPVNPGSSDRYISKYVYLSGKDIIKYEKQRNEFIMKSDNTIVVLRKSKKTVFNPLGIF